MGMERRECLNCGVVTPHHKVDLTAQSIDWTLFVCVECGTRARTRTAQTELARNEQRAERVAMVTARRGITG